MAPLAMAALMTVLRALLPMMVHWGWPPNCSSSSTMVLTSGRAEQAAMQPTESKPTSRALPRACAGDSSRTEHSHSARSSVTLLLVMTDLLCDWSVGLFFIPCGFLNAFATRETCNPKAWLNQVSPWLCASSPGPSQSVPTEAKRK